MSLRLEMLQVARLSPKQLGDSAPLVAAFLHSQRNADGGFMDRAGASDIYYTVFGLEGLVALGEVLPVESASKYLTGFGQGESLDMIHRCCLIRCWSNLNRFGPPLDQPGWAEGIEAFRTPDGGYNSVAAARTGTTYGCFMAMAAYQDLRIDMPNPEGITRCLKTLQTPDGGYANQAGMTIGLTPSSAAAATLLRHLGHQPSRGLNMWLLSRCHQQGGFFATPAAPLPDLLSTATSLHALSGMKASIATLHEQCLDFVDSLWSNTGGFYGHWADDAIDCEYTYYGLLALGHLTL